jgi:phosphohistidine phosphatase
MARLLILRHGKAEDESPSGDDRQRKLVHRGERNADEVGQLIKDHINSPELVLVSPSLRTQETALIVQQHLGHINQVNDSRIYNADGEALLNVIIENAPSLSRVLLIGHNPGLMVLMHILMAEDGNRAETSISDFPSSALAEMVFEAPTIGQIARSSGILLSLMRPRENRK